MDHDHFYNHNRELYDVIVEYVIKNFVDEWDKQQWA